MVVGQGEVVILKSGKVVADRQLHIVPKRSVQEDPHGIIHGIARIGVQDAALNPQGELVAEVIAQVEARQVGPAVVALPS